MIEIKIPYMLDMQLGKAYNISMKSAKDWVLFLDHDLLMLNPHYYEVSFAVTQVLGHKAGWITGVTNAIACEVQLCRDAPKGDNVMEHMRYAKQRWEKFSTQVVKVGDKNIGMNYKNKIFPGFSGFFMLTHRQAWEDVGGFADGFLGVDNIYYRKLIEAGYETYVMPGIYVYHLYRQKAKWSEL
jgi:glycosyltransferase involved in cell wall biosynthesis